MEELTADEMRMLLRSSRLAHVGLAEHGRAYVFPILYGYDGKAFYFRSHPGVKTDLMEATKEACLVVSHVVDEDDWRTVQVFGEVELAQLSDEQLAAMDATRSLPPPPLPGTSEHGEPRRSYADAYFWKLAPTRMSGRKSVRPAHDHGFEVS